MISAGMRLVQELSLHFHLQGELLAFVLQFSLLLESVVTITIQNADEKNLILDVPFDAT
jgi:hypothetical protein